MSHITGLKTKQLGITMSYKNWKECAWKNLNDKKDHGLIKVSLFCVKRTYGDSTGQTGLKSKQTRIKAKVRSILENRLFYSLKTVECLLNVRIKRS